MKNYSLFTLFIALIKGCVIFPAHAVSPIGSSNRFSQRSKKNHHEQSTHNDDPFIQVREVLPTKLQNDIDPELNQIDAPSFQDNQAKSLRRWIWWGKDVEDLNKNRATTKKSERKHEEHPLRTDLWGLQVQWFRGSSPIQSRKTLKMEFHKNGQCRLLSNDEGDNGKVLGIGSWNSRPYAVGFSVSCEEGKYIFTSQLHHNPFGKHPKLQQGTILFEKARAKKEHPYDVLEFDEERDRLFIQPRPKQWFRPIVGKFTGVGIGVDTFDYSYSKRGN
mmetsp:Transcript_7595/g.18284  ORF Transcript_7595/g.18284 Transcript_7595/m.18284 type:complete len:275 (+) Transcript_7595:44-868(+)